MNGTTLLAMSIFSLLCCQILSPVTWFLSNQAITAGTLPANDLSQANIARIIAIIGTVLLVLSLIGYFVLGIGAAATGGAPVVPVQ